MLPDTKRSWGTSNPDNVGIIPPLLIAALASLFLGANTVEIQAIWSLQRRSDSEPTPARRRA